MSPSTFDTAWLISPFHENSPNCFYIKVKKVNTFMLNYTNAAIKLCQYNFKSLNNAICFLNWQNFLKLIIFKYLNKC